MINKEIDIYRVSHSFDRLRVNAVPGDTMTIRFDSFRIFTGKLITTDNCYVYVKDNKVHNADGKIAYNDIINDVQWFALNGKLMNEKTYWSEYLKLKGEEQT